MFLMIDSLLSDTDLTKAQDNIKTLRWEDGRKTAGAGARAVKNNHQADLSSRTGVKLRALLDAAIRTHPVLKAAAQPENYSPLLISRTDVGEGYGMHFDNAYMKTPNGPLRTDLSFTLFLSDPSTYEGGELSIDRPEGTKRAKGEAGSLLLYPSSHLHEVMPVTHGERIVCVGWIQSRVRSAAQREILFDLENIRAELRNQGTQSDPVTLMLGKVLANLKREFSD